jgi:hypothetical protein
MVVVTAAGRVWFSGAWLGWSDGLDAMKALVWRWRWLGEVESV